MSHKDLAATETMPVGDMAGLPIGKLRHRLLPHRQVPERLGDSAAATIGAFGKPFSRGDRRFGGVPRPSRKTGLGEAAGGLLAQREEERSCDWNPRFERGARVVE